MPQTLTLKDFPQKPYPILDVRSPSEYQQGHFPKSHLFSLFSDEESCQIGTLYKKQSRHEAIELGLNLVQPKLDNLLSQASTLLSSAGRLLDFLHNLICLINLRFLAPSSSNFSAMYLPQNLMMNLRKNHRFFQAKQVMQEVYYAGAVECVAALQLAF